MRILVVTGGFPLPSQTFVYRKVVALAKRGHEVIVATRRIGDWSLYPDGLPDGVRVVEMVPDVELRDPRRAFAMVRGAMTYGVAHVTEAKRLYEMCHNDPRTRGAPLRYYLRHLPFLGLRADIVHFEFVSLATMYPLVHDLLGVPIVVSCRGSDIHVHESRPVEEQARAVAALREATALHCVSRAMATDVERISGRSTGIHINRPAVDVSQIHARSPSPETTLRILATGRLVWIKGFDYLLEALALVVRTGVDFRAEILGDGELRQVVRYTIRDLGLTDHVTLPGNVPSTDVLARLQSTDVFVLSSVGEGISNAVLEAMASGVPLVTTNAGGMAEAVADGIEGYVVPVRDAAALAARIISLAKDRDARLSMGLAARRRAERDFSIERQMDVFEEMYRSISA